MGLHLGYSPESRILSFSQRKIAWLQTEGIQTYSLGCLLQCLHHLVLIACMLRFRGCDNFINGYFEVIAKSFQRTHNPGRAPPQQSNTTVSQLDTNAPCSS